MFVKISKSFIRAIVDVSPLFICSLGSSLLICTISGLALGLQTFPISAFYSLTVFLFTAFFLIVKVQKEAKDKIDCYMQAAVCGTFIGLLNSEIIREAGFAYGWLGNPYWEYKLIFFAAACFWHGFIMVLLFKYLKKKKAASLRIQPQVKSLD